MGQLAELSGAIIADRTSAGDDRGARLFSGVAPLHEATAEQVSFFDNRKYRDQLRETGAGACVLRAEDAQDAPGGTHCLVTPEPYRAYALIASAFFPDPSPVPGIAATALIDPTAEIDPSSEIGPGVVIAAGVTIGAGSIIGPQTVIGPGVVIGSQCRIAAHVTLSHCRIGARVRLHPGVRIGQPGFGFALGPAGHQPVPQLGRVLIGDGADIGANVTIDRGAGPDTVIGPGVIIDNQVQIGHNVEIGAGSVIVAQAGISGSTRLGPGVVLAAQAGLAGHLSIGAGARIAAKSGIMRDVPAKAEMMGYPAVEKTTFFRQVAALAKLARPGSKRRNEGK